MVMADLLALLAVAPWIHTSALVCGVLLIVFDVKGSGVCVPS